MMKQKILLIVFIFCSLGSALAQVWQWSVKVDSLISTETNDHPQAFLWIPENCKQVRGVVFTQHNMVEEGMLEHPSFRRTMTELGFAEVWVTPCLTINFDFNKDAAEDFNRMMKLLAEVSGYIELENVPIIPMGHSALATFPWNLAAWKPERTIALVSVHGDAPQTTLTGYGRANVEWGNRNIDGVPALFIMGEYEWWEDRIAPAFKYIANHPNSVISLFCDAGHGHFDYSDEMIEYVCMFIKKAASKRLPRSMSLQKPNVLIPVKPQQGWLMDRWHKDSLPTTKAAPFTKYNGNRQFSSWVFDEEMVKATEHFYAASRGKQPQFIGFRQNGKILEPNKSHANYSLKFIPLPDGISFTLSAFFADSSRKIPADLYARTPFVMDRICGPVKKVDDTTFQLNFYRMGFNNPKRSNDIWLLAHNKGDEKYKSAVQQVNMRFPLENKGGRPQEINFPTIGNQKKGVESIGLQATSTAGLPVFYYVKEGPANMEGSQLIITKVPPRSKYPVKITIVAWQYGIVGDFQSARPVEQTFYIIK